jgi:PPOX class probable F420-dependent enzyme
MPDIHPTVAEFLQGHRTAVLATQRKTGAPQLTLIAYQFDGNDIVISTRAPTQKAKNISRRPEVSLAVIDNDGSRQLIVYATCHIVRDEAEVLRLNRERLSLISRYNETDAELQERLKREERVVLVLTPTSFFHNLIR